MSNKESVSESQGALSFSAGELAALIELSDTEAARATGRLLRLDQLDDLEVAQRYGISSLVARGLAVVEGDQVSSSREATAVAALMNGATMWAEIGLVNSTNSEGALLVSGADGTLLFAADVAETYTVVGLEQGQHLGTIVSGMTFAFLDESAPAAAAISVTRGDTVDRYAVRRNADGAWDLAEGEYDSAGLLPSRVVAREEAFAAISAAWPEDT